eukprot:374686_1
MFIRHVFGPEPVALPHKNHLLNGHILGLRQEEGDEHRHYHHPSAEEVEEPELHHAQHGQKELPDHERAEHVHRDGDALPGRPNLKREDLTRHQPPERTP